MLTSIVPSIDPFRNLTSDEIYTSICNVIAQLDPLHKNHRERVANLRTILQLIPQLTIVNRLELIIQLYGVNRNADDEHAYDPRDAA